MNRIVSIAGRQRVTSLSCLALSCFIAFSADAAAQIDCAAIPRAYVEPGFGDDISASADVAPVDGIADGIDDPTRAFKTLNRAILEVRNALTVIGDPDLEGIVYANPGVYGPTGSGDALPIVMRNQVHVQGVGARRCVIEGVGIDNQFLLDPNAPTCGTPGWQVEVLVDFSYISAVDGNDTVEFLDAFSFVGGDIQVLVGLEGPSIGRVSNCLFDMRVRDGAGPVFGVAMYHIFDLGLYDQQGEDEGASRGYHDLPMQIVSNTFLMGDAFGGLCDPDAVAIIDYNDPVCPPAGGDPDPDPRIRGVGNPLIHDNLIRTGPEQQPLTVMLGIDSTDTDAIGGIFQGAAITSATLTNSFDPARVGPGNGRFFSALAEVFHTYPVPQVPIGANADPGFVGEVLVASFGIAGYEDWRILPDSPLVNRGVRPADVGGGVFELEAVNGTILRESPCAELRTFDWDGEYYGNLRVQGRPGAVADVDIGFDETSSFVMAGTYVTGENSHGDAPGILNPSVGGFPNIVRNVLLPAWIPNGTTFDVMRVSQLPALQPIPWPLTGALLRAWITQPTTIAPPLFNLALLPRYEAAYIALGSGFTTPPWAGVVPAVTLVANPMVPAQSHVFRRILISDDDSTSPTTYFSSQAIYRTLAGIELWSNVQSEYR
jgi:hypothetical protein